MRILPASRAQARAGDGRMKASGLTRRDFLALGVTSTAVGSIAGAQDSHASAAALPATDLARLTATEAAALIRQGSVSAVELVNACLARIEQVNPRLNAVVSMQADQAKREAGLKDAALARGETPGPLHGVPMTIKDSFDTAGLRTTYGTTGRASFVPARD